MQAPQTLRFPTARGRALPAWLATHGPLLAILLLQTIASLSLRNAAFQDEALYVYAGRQLISMWFGGPFIDDPYGAYFSGMPHFYPVIAGALDMIGGLEAARMFSLVWMLITTAMVYQLGRLVFNRESGVLAALIFACQGTVLFLGRFATFDALSLGLLACGAVLAIRSGQAETSGGARLLGLLLLLAVAAKYAALLFVPTILGLLAWYTWRRYGWKEALIRVEMALILPLVLGGAFLVLTAEGRQMLTGLTRTTTDRTVLIGAPFSQLLERAMLGGVLLGLALLGLVASLRSRRLVALELWRTRHERRLVALALFGTALLPIAYHFYKGELVSMHKHVAFGLLFAAPLAGYAVHLLIDQGGRLVQPGLRWLAGVSLCLLIFSSGLAQAQRLFDEWPDTVELIQTLRTQVRPDSGRILAEASEVPRYYLQDVVSNWQWSNLYWFEYTTPDGAKLQGIPAYQAAIDNGYFEFVILHYDGPSANVTHQIDGNLQNGKHYELVRRIPYQTIWGQGDFWLWRRRGAED